MLTCITQYLFIAVCITGWAIARTCCISQSAKYRKTAILIPQEVKTYVSICMKLGMVDYVSDPTPHAKFGGRRSTYVV